MSLLEQEAQLQQIVRLVGADSLPDRQRWVLDTARLLEEGFLQQNALHAIDAYSTPEKQVKLLHLFLDLYRAGLRSAGARRARLSPPRNTGETAVDSSEGRIPNDNSSQIDQVRQELKNSFRRWLTNTENRNMTKELG